MPICAFELVVWVEVLCQTAQWCSVRMAGRKEDGFAREIRS